MHMACTVLVPSIVCIDCSALWRIACSQAVLSDDALCCIQAGVKGTAITFLMTDNQIVNEKFLVYINDLLSTGYIADLCTQEDKDTFCNSVRGELKQAGMVDSADNCWDYFIDKV